MKLITASGLTCDLTNQTFIPLNAGTGGNGEYQLDGNRILAAPSNNPDRGPWNPLWSALAGSYAIYPDEEFASGNNSVALYDNGSPQIYTTLTRVAGQPGVPNASGYVLKISYLGGGTPDSNPTPGYGGFFQTILPSANRTYVQRFIAKLPIGRKFMLAENPQGNNNTSYWLTSQLGTGKWEQYTRVSHAGNSASALYVGGIPNGGTGYTLGTVLEAIGGTLAPGGVATRLTVTSISGGVVTGLSVTGSGTYLAQPPSPTSFNVISGTGSGASVYIGYNFQLGGHVYVSSGANAAFDWYVASCNVYEVNSAARGAVPLGGIIPFLKSFTAAPAVPPEYIECNGGTYIPPNQTYPFWNGGSGITVPNLNGVSPEPKRFLRGATASGAVGGSEMHTHSISTGVFSPSGSAVNYGNAFATGSTSTLPFYYEVVYIMRVK